MNTHREIAYRLDPALWMREVLGIAPRPWQEKFLCAPRGASMLALTARQVGKTTAAAVGMAHSAMFMPGSLSVVACPNQQQSAEAVRKVKEMVLKAGATLVSDNVYALELANGSRVKALPGSDDSVRGLTVDAWIVADEAARLTPELIAALRPMRAQRPHARFVMLSTAWSRTDPFWTAWASDDPSWLRFQVTVDLEPTLYDAAYLAKERHALGEAAYKREFLGIPAAGQVSPFEWQLYERATKRQYIPTPGSSAGRSSLRTMLAARKTARRRLSAEAALLRRSSSISGTSMNCRRGSTPARARKHSQRLIACTTAGRSSLPI